MRLVEQASLTKKNSKPLINTRIGLAPDRTSRDETRSRAIKC